MCFIISQLLTYKNNNKQKSFIMKLNTCVEKYYNYKCEITCEELLDNEVNCNIHLIDERLTTTEAENLLISMDKTREKRKKVIDGVAACLILESFIRERNLKDGQ